MKILLTNDDGIHAQGIHILNDYLSQRHEIFIAAPDKERSAASHSISLNTQLRINKHAPNQFSITGTPVDTVFVAINYLLKEPPDLIISGINHGANMGEDVFYSGTVAAAFEGAFRHVKSIAISCVQPNDYFDGILPWLFPIIDQFHQIPESKIININYPSLPENQIKGIKMTQLGKRYYKNELIEKKDELNETYFMIGGEGPFWEKKPDSDFCAVADGYISITPLSLSLTDQSLLNHFRRILGQL